MDEGLIYEEGPPAQIFDHPQRQRTRDFIGKVRSLSYHVSSADYDLYALVGKIEGFCEKHLIPPRAAHAAQLLAEEVLGVLLASATLAGTIQTGTLPAASLTSSTAATVPNPTIPSPTGPASAAPIQSGPTPHDIDLVLAYSEKQRSLELRLDSLGPAGNPLETSALPDDLALTLIRNYAEDIVYERIGDRNRLRMRVR